MKKFFSYVFLTFLSLPAAQGSFKTVFTQFTNAVKSVKNNPYMKVQNKGQYIEELSTSEEDITFPDAMREERKDQEDKLITPKVLFGAVCRVYPKIGAVTQQLNSENKSPITSSSMSFAPRERVSPYLYTKKSSPIQNSQPPIQLTPLQSSFQYPY